MVRLSKEHEPTRSNAVAFFGFRTGLTALRVPDSEKSAFPRGINPTLPYTTGGRNLPGGYNPPYPTLQGTYHTVPSTLHCTTLEIAPELIVTIICLRNRRVSSHAAFFGFFFSAALPAFGFASVFSGVSERQFAAVAWKSGSAEPMMLFTS